jgi:DNA-directed RNA polymerase subunit alpha
MIQANPNLEILDPQSPIATLSEEGKLEMEMRVKRGRGYTSADRNFDDDLSIGYIPIDSVHSPVRKVAYHVEDARLGQTTDYDKLTLEVWTDGSISPQDAVGLAAKLIKDHMSIFINFEEQPSADTEELTEDAERLNENLNRSVDELDPSVRSYNCPRTRTSGRSPSGAEDRGRDAAHQELGRKSLTEIKNARRDGPRPRAGSTRRRGSRSDRALPGVPERTVPAGVPLRSARGAPAMRNGRTR